MTKYKWSFLGLIVSIILFLLFLINPLTNFINKATIPAEPIPIEYKSTNPLMKYIDKELEHVNSFIEFVEKDEAREMAYEEWYKNVPKKFNWSALSIFGKSFYKWNLFWIPIIIFSVLMANYKKERK